MILIVWYLQDDYRRAIRELDEKEFITLRLVCAELRNHYVSIPAWSDEWLRRKPSDYNFVNIFTVSLLSDRKVDCKTNKLYKNN